MATNVKGQGILLLHGEKIAIAIVGALALWIVYSSLKLPRLDDKHQAAELQREITQSSTQIKGYTWDMGVKEHPDKVKLAVPIAVKNDFSVKAVDYVIGDPIGKAISSVDPPIVAPMVVRTDPLLMNAEGVRAYGGSGLFAFVDEKIRKERQLRLATEQAQQLKKEEEKQKKLEKQQRESAGAGPRRRGPEGLGEYGTELNDPAHPKRRRLEGGFRPTGLQLQGDERIERAYWACVVAKVPIRQQFNLYEDALKNARGYDQARDFPHYVGFYVERADVLPGKPLEWKPVPLYDGQHQSILANKSLTSAPKHGVGTTVLGKLFEAAQLFWAGGISPDVVDDRFRETALTLPLPPLIGREWGAEATHPDIPLAIDTPALEQETAPLAAQTPEQQPAATDTGSEFNSTNVTAPAPGAFGSPGPRRMSEYPGAMNRMAPRGYGPEGPGPGPGPGMRSFGMRGSAGPEGGPSYRGSSGAATVQHATLIKGVDYYLLRFFDHTVEPGKKYKYRVKLVLADPNYGMPANVLAQAVQDRQGKEAQVAKAHNGQKPSFRLVESWSEPSPTVGIPLAGNVRLADVKIPPAEKFNDEPLVKLLVESFDVDDKGNAIQAAAEKDFRRGFVANFVEDTEYLGPDYIDTQPAFKFHTGMTLLDVDGGGKLPAKDMTVPARILVMGPSGELYIRHETDDKPFVEYHRFLFDKRRGPGGVGPEGPGPGPERGRGGRH